MRWVRWGANPVTTTATAARATSLVGKLGAASWAFSFSTAEPFFDSSYATNSIVHATTTFHLDVPLDFERHEIRNIIFFARQINEINNNNSK